MEAKLFKWIRSFVLLVLLTAIVSLYPSLVSAATNHCGDLPEGEDAWFASDNVHLVTCDVTIPAGRTLTIEAGTIVKFRQNTQINVNGRIVVEGTSDSPIYFTSYRDDTIGGDTDGTPDSVGAVLDWGNIQFSSGSDDTSIITRAVIRYSGDDTGLGFDPNDAAIRLSNASPNLSYITFSNNYINGAEVVAGNWQTDTWDNTTVIYYIRGDVTVPAANVLTINPGVKVKLGKASDIYIGGKLVAVGTRANPIYFSSSRDDELCGIGAFDENICDMTNNGPTAGAVYDWGHIQFNNSSDDTSIITRAVIRYSGDDANAGFNPFDGAIRLSNASPELSYITFNTNYINGVEITEGTWNTDVWDNPTVVYVFQGGDVSIPAANTLTINPAMKIKLAIEASLIINGKLIVPGTVDNPVYFSSKKDDTLCGIGAFDELMCDTNNNGPSAGAIGDWGNIRFSGGSDDTSTITGAIIRFSGKDYIYLRDGAIRLDAASPSISYSSLAHNYQGLQVLNSSTPTLICNDVYSNTSYSVYNNTPTTIVSAENHWWGSASGPPSGKVSSGVDYTPWATQSCLLPPLLPPIAPSNLQATAIDSTHIRLDWSDNSDNEAGFYIEDGDIFVSTVGTNITSYTVGGLVPNSYHCYHIYAFNDIGNSEWTDWACATTSVGVSADLALVQPIEVTNKLPPYAPSNLTLETKVKNQSSSVTTPGVTVTFYDGNPDSGGITIGSTLAGDLSPGVSKMASINWGLNGNIENHRVYARVSTSASISDPNVSNNTTSRPISAYYVNFQHDRDAYSFYNSEVGKVTNNDILEFLGNFEIPELLKRPVLLPILVFATGKNGFCFGMSNSSLVYFFHPELKPIPPKITFNYTVPEARAKIRTYQWYALEPFIQAILGISSSDPNEQYRLTLENIREGRPVIHALMDRPGFFPNPGSHAVVAYKIVDLGNEKRVFYYDNNLPLDAFPGNVSETYGVFSGSGYSESIYRRQNINFNKAYVFGPQLSNSDDLNLLLLELAKLILGSQFSDGFLTITSNGAVDLIAVDSLGRRTGYLEGQEYNEIPEAKVASVDGSQSLILPTNNEYRFQINRINVNTASLDKENLSSSGNTFSIDVVDSISISSARIIQFQNVPLNQGQIAALNFSHGLQDPRMTLPGGMERLPETNEIFRFPEPKIFLPVITR